METPVIFQFITRGKKILDRQKILDYRIRKIEIFTIKKEKSRKTLRNESFSAFLTVSKLSQ